MDIWNISVFVCSNVNQKRFENSNATLRKTLSRIVESIQLYNVQHVSVCNEKLFLCYVRELQIRNYSQIR